MGSSSEEKRPDAKAKLENLYREHFVTGLDACRICNIGVAISHCNSLLCSLLAVT